MIATAEQEVAALQARYLPAVKASIRDAVPDSDSGFFKLLRYHLGWEDADGRPADEDSGKALRPLLCLMACELAGGDWRTALPAAAALELVHNFSLIHDDIQDGDTTRRGRATLWSVRGIPEAVAAGNAMRSVADRVFSGLAVGPTPPHVAAFASMRLTQGYLEMIEGQYLDISFEQAERVSVDDYLDMISRKTGALIESAMFLGALIATGNERAATAFGACGRKLGLAFQIRDDYLGVWGDPQSTGKAVGADIRRKKKALPMVYMLQHAAADNRAWVNAAMAVTEVAVADVERMLALLEKLDARQYVQQVAESHAADAVTTLEQLGLAQEACQKLRSVAEFFVTRQK